MIICLDFDETLCALDDTPMPGTRSALAQLQGQGHELIVSSARFSLIYGDLNLVRREKLQAWFDHHQIEVSLISLLTPKADLYVDDRGFRFSGNWENDLPRIINGIQLNKTVSLDIDTILNAPSAKQAISGLEKAGAKIYVSMGLDEPEEMIPAQHKLKDAGFGSLRIYAEKMPANLYVNSRSYFFQGDWAAALPEILERLST